MSNPMTAQEVLDREFFELRAKVLQLGASLDRMERAGGELEGDPKLALIHQGIEILLDQKPKRAERIQLLFSREYENDWKSQYDLDT